MASVKTPVLLAGCNGKPCWIYPSLLWLTDFHTQAATESKEGLEGGGGGGNLKGFQFSFQEKKKNEEGKEKRKRKKRKIVLAEISFANWENIQKPDRRKIGWS